MSDELKPARCGCGGEAIIGLKEWEDRKGNYHKNSFVYCDNCSISTGGYLTESEAIEAWNRAMCARTAKVKKGAYDLMRCECGMPVSSNYDYCPKCRARLEWEQ